MDCDEESEYSYEYEEDFGLHHSVITSEVDDGIVAQLESEVADVNSKYGQDCAHFLKATDCDRIRHGTNFNGFIYMFLSLNEKESVGRLWGFNPAQPIVLRFAHYFVSARTPLASRKDLMVTVYQGNEPPLMSVAEKNDDESDDSSSSTTGGAERKPDSKEVLPSIEALEINVDASMDTASIEGDGEAKSTSAETSTCVNVIESISTVPFRIGDQIQRLAEEYLMENLPLALSKQCQTCTYLNSADLMRCSMCDGTELVYVNGEGLLPSFFGFLSESILQLNLFCVNCCAPHMLGSIQPSYPTVCQRELCQWALTELGIGRASIDDMALHAEVVDLLLAITRAAATSGRAAQILSPFPLVFVKNNDGVKELALGPESPDCIKAGEAAKLLPSMQNITESKNENELEDICNESGPYVYGLLQWIINSCPARILSLQGAHRLQRMGTEYQFLIRSAAPDLEKTFAEAKVVHGSSFAFHGSSIENWHAILRKGLLNCSGTSLQLHGASYGSGVYLSPNASMSLGYSKVKQHTIQCSGAQRISDSNGFISDKDVCVMALCEVIDSNAVRKNGDIWVVPNEKHVIPRFLFVFVPSMRNFQEVLKTAAGCNTNNGGFDTDIRALCGQVLGTGLYQ